MRPVATPHADCAPSASGPAISGFPPKALETSPWQSARSPHRSPPRRGCSQDQLSPSPDAPARARSSPPRSSVRSDAARLRLLDAPSRTAPQDRRAPQDWSYPSPQSLSEAHPQTDLPPHQHARPSPAPPSRPSRSPPRDRSPNAPINRRFSFLITLPPPRITLFPYTTPF